MSNAKSPGGGTKKPADSSQAGTGKKSKSKGFIETSGYKPGWLETGPLPADILPEPAAPVDDSSIAEEFAALQEALQSVIFHLRQQSAVLSHLLKRAIQLKSTSTQILSIYLFLTKSLLSVKPNGNLVSQRLQQATLPVMQNL